MARIVALIRRANLRHEDVVLKVGTLQIDPLQRLVSSGDRNIDLSPREFALLEFLMRNAGRTVSRSRIAEAQRTCRCGRRRHGVGIAPEDLDRVFDRFHRAEHSRSRAHGGAGLGLTIARMLAELQGGSISVDSTPNEGSRFVLWLPAGD